MEYKINEDECARRNYLQNLIEVTVTKMAKHDPAMTFIINATREFKSATLGDMNMNTSFKNEQLQKLKKLYITDPILSTKVHLKICDLCPDNQLCPQYQNYLVKV